MKTNGRRFEVTRDKISRAARLIAARFRPDKVILFGSWARGQAGPDSDVDLLVVMPVIGSKRRKGIEMMAALHRLPIPIDIVVVTPQEFADYADVVGTIVYPAVREGKVLYA